MNIVLVTNTFTTHVGGVARSVEAFAEEFRRRGHRVLVIAPEFPETPAHETDVIRIPAIRKFNASDFSVALPVPTGLTERLGDFEPDIFHSQHPFLLGMTAVRMARAFRRPLIFTHHTFYEQYTHYVPGDSDLMRRFIVDLAKHYANLCDLVFAPSESVCNILVKRGVTTPIHVIPTGVKVENFSAGNGATVRSALGIPEKSFLVGHMGRLAPEKNLEFLAEAVTRFLSDYPQTCFLLVGSGPYSSKMDQLFKEAGVSDRVFHEGILQHTQLADALCAMDVFAFASKSETQGMVLTEAMASGVPVVALDAPGAREVVRSGYNGQLVPKEDVEDFAAALAWVMHRPTDERQQLTIGARAVADEFSLGNTATKALSCYEAVQLGRSRERHEEERSWEQMRRLIAAEWEVLKSLSKAGEDALSRGS